MYVVQTKTFWLDVRYPCNKLQYWNNYNHWHWKILDL